MKALFVLICGWSVFAHAAPQIAAVRGADLLSGKTVAASVDGKKGAVVVFLSAVCPCSDSHIQELASLAGEYSEFAFFAIHSNVDESDADSKTYFEKVKLPFVVIQDAGAKLADEFKASKTPHSFVLLANGDVVYRGGVSSSRHFEQAEHKYLREALADLRAGRPVKTAEGRTLGCAISRGDQSAW